MALWQEEGDKTWKEFIGILAMMDQCRKAKELTNEKDVYFFSNEKALGHCPTLNDKIL